MKKGNLLATFICLAILGFVACKKKGVETGFNSSPVTPTPATPNTPTTPTPVNETAFAFPGAEGFGRATTGGRGGKVIFVTTTADGDQAGTLRYAINQKEPRIIIFKVSGIIQLNSTLTIKEPNVTIAGQTAPGDGICLSRNTLTIDADNVIIRHLRCRLGNDPLVENDAMNGRNHQNIIIDHCSLSWSVDETGSFYDNKNFTLQWCILSESLYNAGHVKGEHGYGGIWGGQGASFHHNLITDHSNRNPRFCGSRYTGKPDLEIVDFRNNVIYNWGNGNNIYGNEGGNLNIVNNYYKVGPSTTGTANKTRLFQYTGYSTTDGVTTYGGKVYMAGNYLHGNANVSADNWLGVQGDNTATSSQIAAAKQTSPFTFGTITTQTAEAAFTKVLDSAGAILPKRDAVDIRIVNETRTGTETFGGMFGAAKGIIDLPSTVGGWPTYNSTTPPTDTDSDGMPDAWETSKGLDPKAANANGRNLSTAYDNIEVYINSIK